ncbi:MAG: hypothetical protein Q4A86_02165 [Clostridia bacterium]|nr:hypothetical protein [Clostridia bacterium]
MAEEYREYKPRRTTRAKSQSGAKKFGYFKKLLKQTFFSALILGAIFTPELFKAEVSAKIKSAAKSALNYTVDASKITKTLQQLFNSTANQAHEGEQKDAKTEVLEKNL